MDSEQVYKRGHSAPLFAHLTIPRFYQEIRHGRRHGSF